MSAPDPNSRSAGQPAVPTSTEVRVQRWHEEGAASATDVVAEESPIALRYQGTPYVVMLATPADLEDLAVGFTVSEAIVASPDEIRHVQQVTAGDALEVHIDIAPPRFAELLRRQRNLTGRTGCGLCGAETVEGAIRRPPPVRAGLELSPAALHAALRELAAHQPLNERAGSVHAAAWVLPHEGIQVVREDVGRHNALDKLIGALIRRKADIASGYVIITSRASYEMVQKAATVGVQLLAAISAPTGLAVRLAESCSLTLVGFARPGRHVIYSHPHRLRT
ncbi:MAG: formate dehydrogenase accessory sulfurtransferase FdhD [Gammaproteobacteria bacterium]|nr:formate dehydrogenase accessory sulfurtransferase FdhD [Gammaproteobacteria bacterium]